MSATPAELMKEYVNSQNFSSTTEAMAAMKEMFKDVLQQVMECELHAKLGYEKSERTSDNDETTVSKNCSISKSTDPALYHSSNTLQHKICWV